MTTDLGDDDDGHSIARRILRQQLRVFEALIRDFRQVESVVDILSDGGRARVLFETEQKAREFGIAMHDLARLLHDLRATQGD